MGIFLALGANLGERRQTLESALRALHGTPGIEVLQASPLYETEPIGELNQPLFLNAVVEIKTELAPLELLNATQGIEQALGREPSYRWGPRAIDIDIVLWDDMVLDTERLSIPHPRFRERAFVLAPLAAIAPKVVDPVSGRSTDALLAEIGEQGIAITGSLEIP